MISFADESSRLDCEDSGNPFMYTTHTHTHTYIRSWEQIYKEVGYLKYTKTVILIEASNQMEDK